VEEVSGLPQFGYKLTWRELLSSDEIRAWVADRKIPDRLRCGGLAYPGVYRFIFPEVVDSNARHTPFYVGEGGDIGKRLKGHFAPSSNQEKRDSKGVLILKSGWQVRGNIQNSQGEFSLQILKLEGSINICGVMLNQHSLDSPFARRLIENWAILYSQKPDKHRQLNRGASQGAKDFFRNVRKVQAASRKKAKVQ
jgi:hypothetical protein